VRTVIHRLRINRAKSYTAIRKENNTEHRCCALRKYCSDWSN